MRYGHATLCGTCGTLDNSQSDVHGIHTCVHCGKRYRMRGGMAVPLAGVASPRRTGSSPALAIAGAAFVIVAAGAVVGATFLLRREQDAP